MFEVLDERSEWEAAIVMAEYPEKTCTVDQLVTNDRMVESALSGQKVQQRRNGVYAYPGERFDLSGVPFEVTSVEQQRLGDMTESDARKEGFPDLDTYRSIIVRMHGGMEWDVDQKVWLHEFAKCTGELGQG